MTRIRTKNAPDKVITVGDAELLDLERLGLVDTYVSGPKAKKSSSTSASTEKADDGDKTEGGGDQ